MYKLLLISLLYINFNCIQLMGNVLEFNAAIPCQEKYLVAFNELSQEKQKELIGAFPFYCEDNPLFISLFLWGKKKFKTNNGSTNKLNLYFPLSLVQQSKEGTLTVIPVCNPVSISEVIIVWLHTNQKITIQQKIKGNFLNAKFEEVIALARCLRSKASTVNPKLINAMEM